MTARNTTNQRGTMVAAYCGCARPVAEGTNLSLIDIKSPDELLFRQKLIGVWLASPIQVYLDLLRGEGRAKDLAAHLRRERIGF